MGSNPTAVVKFFILDTLNLKSTKKNIFILNSLLLKSLRDKHNKRKVFTNDNFLDTYIDDSLFCINKAYFVLSVKLIFYARNVDYFI